MKFYYFLVISLGLMALFGFFGVDGVGGNVLGFLLDDNNEPIAPVTEYESSGLNTVGTATDNIQSTSTPIWTKFLIALVAIYVIGTFVGIIPGIGNSLDVAQMARAVIAYSMFGLFASDVWGIFSLVYGDAGWTWTSAFLFILISLYLVGFAISCLEFVGGTD